MNRFKNLIALSLFLLACTWHVSAQTTDQVEMADVFHTNGKIYVVVTILSVVFTGIVALLIRIDRKVSKLEKELQEKKG